MTDRIRISDDVLIQELPDGQAVLLQIASETYFSIDQVGREIWKALAETGSIGDTVDRLSSVYEDEAETLRSDVEEFVEELVERGLVSR